MAEPHPIPDVDPPLTPEEEVKYAALKADIDIAYEALMAGNVVDGKEVFAELYAKYGKPPDDDPDDD